MKKTALISCLLLATLVTGCPEDDSDLLVVDADVRATLSGDGMPADQRQKTFTHDELWLDVDVANRLEGFQAHPWDLEPRQHTYDLQLKFAPVTALGTTEIVSARVCVLTCGDHPEKDGCGGNCFWKLQSGTANVRSVSSDGKSFDVDFEFEVTDERGRTVTVSSGSARRTD